MKTPLPILSLICLAFLLPVAQSAQAQMPDELNAWTEGPASVLVTAEERQAYATLQNDDQREAFIELFWAKRDPDLSTRDNEFRFDFDARVEAADREFSSDQDRGAQSARGEVLILLGMPDRHAQMRIGDYLATVYEQARPDIIASNPNADATMQGVTFNRAKGMADAWAYKAASLPAGAVDGDDDITFAFFDTHGNGTFRLQGGIRRALEAEQVLAKAPAALIVNPDLTEIPSFAALAGVPSATAEMLSILDGGTLTWPDDAIVTSAQGIASLKNHPNWIFVLLPSGSVDADVVVGRVFAEDQSLIGSFQLPVSPVSTALGAAYTFALPATGNQAKLDFALLAGVELVAGTNLALDFEEIEEGKVHFSQAFAGAEISSARDAAAGDPFVFGGYRVVPRPEGRYTTSENLSVFCLASVPEALGPEGQEVKVRLRWYVGGKPAPSAQPQKVSLLPGGPGVWVWGTQLPLSSMSPGTDYMLKVKISSKDGSDSRTTEIPVLMRAVNGEEQ